MEYAQVRWFVFRGRMYAVKKIHIVFHDGGGGHRNAAVALQTMISEQQRDWQVELVQFQDLTDRLDILRKLTGIRIQQQYNVLLQNGWMQCLSSSFASGHHPLVSQTLGAPA